MGFYRAGPEHGVGLELWGLVVVPGLLWVREWEFGAQGG